MNNIERLKELFGDEIEIAEVCSNEVSAGNIVTLPDNIVEQISKMIEEDPEYMNIIKNYVEKMK